MTCFWDGIISSLNQDDLNSLGLSKNPTPIQLAKRLKNLNTKTTNILWEGKALSSNELEENYIHISDYISESVNEGYLCSVCDPFLCILCELLKINIYHTYLSKTIGYTYPNASRILQFQSNRGHFWKKNKY